MCVGARARLCAASPPRARGYASTCVIHILVLVHRIQQIVPVDLRQSTPPAESTAEQSGSEGQVRRLTRRRVESVRSLRSRAGEHRLASVDGTPACDGNRWPTGCSWRIQTGVAPQDRFERRVH